MGRVRIEIRDRVRVNRPKFTDIEKRYYTFTTQNTLGARVSVRDRGRVRVSTRIRGRVRIMGRVRVEVRARVRVNRPTFTDIEKRYHTFTTQNTPTLVVHVISHILPVFSTHLRH